MKNVTDIDGDFAPAPVHDASRVPDAEFMSQICLLEDMDDAADIAGRRALNETAEGNLDDVLVRLGVGN